MKNNKLVYLAILLFLLIATFFISLLFGSTDLSIKEMASGLFSPDPSNINTSIIWQIRLPRILLSIFVGMGLSVSGCVFQNILKNPLADPYTLGISGGAALGTTLGIVTGISGLSLIFLPLSAFIGSMLSIFFVYGISLQKQFSNQIMILSGVILGFVFSAMVLLIFSFVSAEKMQSAMMWLMGDLTNAEPLLIKITAFTVLTGTIILFYFSRDMDIITLGEDKAISLGINVRFMKGLLFLTVSLITAVCVSVSGIIGFVGLIIPHAVKKYFGPAHKPLIPACALAGAIFLTVCDTFSRTIVSPIELPVGVVTGLLGGIFLLIFLFGSQKRNY